MKEKRVNSTGNIISFPDRHRLQEEASYWLIKLDSDDLSSEDSLALREWLDSNPDHKETLLELAVLWNKMDVLSELSELFPLSRTTRSGSLFSARHLAAAACILIAVAMGIYLGTGFREPNFPIRSQTDTVYRTAVGERRLVNLPDGSAATLNTDTVLQVAYSKNLRNIRLVKGEAHFNVAHNKNRPFLVYAGAGVIRAVGTAFSVHLKGKDVEVLVDQGTVKIASTRGIPIATSTNLDEIKPDDFKTTITAGQSVEYENKDIHPVQKISPKLISQKLSWEHGMLVFDGDPLDKVVREISRYTNTRIIIKDPALRNIKVGGYFKTGETGALLSVLQDNFSIHVEHVNDNLIYLTGAKIQQASRDVEQPIETER